MEERPVFVYGTLKKGQPNNFLLNDKTKGIAMFLGKAKLIDKYPLVVVARLVATDVTYTNAPILLLKKGVGKVSIACKHYSYEAWYQMFPIIMSNAIMTFMSNSIIKSSPI